MDNVSGSAKWNLNDQPESKQPTKKTKKVKITKLDFISEIKQANDLRTNLLSKYSNHAEKNLNDAIRSIESAINSLEYYFLYL